MRKVIGDVIEIRKIPPKNTAVSVVKQAGLVLLCVSPLTYIAAVENPIPAIIDMVMMAIRGKQILPLILKTEKTICSTGASIMSSNEIITNNIL
jgi:hypothetical protein